MFLFVLNNKFLCIILILSKLNEIRMENLTNAVVKGKDNIKSEDFKSLYSGMLWSYLKFNRSDTEFFHRIQVLIFNENNVANVT